MTYEIVARVNEMRRSASHIEENAETIRREVDQVRELLEPLRRSFLGNRATDFFRKYDRAYVDMQEWDNLVRSFAEELRIAANRMEQADTPD